jgi:hypothetical protein
MYINGTKWALVEIDFPMMALQRDETCRRISSINIWIYVFVGFFIRLKKRHGPKCKIEMKSVYCPVRNGSLNKAVCASS